MQASQITLRTGLALSGTLARFVSSTKALHGERHKFGQPVQQKESEFYVMPE